MVTNEGFVSASNGKVDSIVNLVIPESVSPLSLTTCSLHSYLLLSKGNDTLDDSMCPAQPDLTDEHVAPWVQKYATPIAERLNTLAPGANLSASDVSNLFALCAFDSVKGKFSKPKEVRASDVCGLFDEDEFWGFEYDQDLDKYYYTGCVFMRFGTTFSIRFSYNMAILIHIKIWEPARPGPRRRLRERTRRAPHALARQR